MHDFEYVKPNEWKPVREELYRIIHQVQDEVREHFTFQYKFVGSSARNMITRDRMSNIGFDFDVNIEVNDPDEDYAPGDLRNILRQALDRVNHSYGHPFSGYDYTENSTRVLTIKVKDRRNSKILHSCDFCIIYECDDGRQQYVRYNKKHNRFSWEYQKQSFKDLPVKIDYLKKHRLWNQVRNHYIYRKNINNNPDKHSRSLFAETVEAIWEKTK